MLSEGVTCELLLVEDHEDAAEMLVDVLGAHGFAVTAVPDTAKALRLLDERAFDIVVSDFVLRTLDEARAQLDALRVHAQPIPVGLLTGHSFPAGEGAKLGMAFVLTKPCSISDLLEQLSLALNVPALSSEREAAARAYLAALQRGDLEALGDLCTAEVIYNLPAARPPLPDLVVGRKAFLELVRSTFAVFMQPTFELLQLRPLPSGALVRYTGSWTDEAGVRRSLPGAIILRFDGSKIREIGVRTAISELRA